MKNLYDAADVTTSAAGIGFGISNIQSILGLILLILSIINIAVKMIIAIFNRIDKKEYNKIPDEIDKAIEDFKEVHKDE